MASVIAAADRWLRHFARIRYRLLLINLIVAVVPLVGIAFAEMHERQLLAALERDMIHQGELVRAMLHADTGQPLAAYEAVLVSAARDTSTRIRLLDRGGHVQADSHRGGPTSVVDRREIKQALAGRYGSAARLWKEHDRVFLFSALPVVDGGGSVRAVVYVTKSTHDVKVQLFVLRTWLFRILIATLVVTALITLLLATTIARPLSKLTRRAQRIASRQSVDSAAKLTRRADEIGQLARAVEAMTAELERRARDARTLAADISHEFKTPLTGIRGAAELLRDGAIEDLDARDRFLAMIVDDAARLDRLVSRLLELARVEDDSGEVAPVDLAAVARRCAARSWPIAVEVVCTGTAVAVGRETALSSAVDNLVANAVQHAAPGTTVEIALERGARCTRINVANHGAALSPAARAKVWDRFYSTRTTEGGTGLGLAIVRSVALAHGGVVGVDCADGVTRFWLEIAR